MDEVVEIKVIELYNTLMEKPLKILEIFNNFFGEDKVDMQEFITLSGFKDLISNIHISEYFPTEVLKYTYWNDYVDKPITELKGETLNLALSVIENCDAIEKVRTLIPKQGFIIVHFPSVRITNENDKFVDITHLYAKVKFNYDGLVEGTFGLNRSEYSCLHFSNNYMHSHVCDIPTYDFTKFQSPCLGQGPIRATLSSLNLGYNIELWQLFCLELNKYVQVESLIGTPYHRLESLGRHDSYCKFETFTVTNKLDIESTHYKNMIKDFIPFLINNKKLKFNYIHGNYSIGMSFNEFMITISNEFIDWYNNKFNANIYTMPLNTLLSKRTIIKCIIYNNKIYEEKNLNINKSRYEEYIGKKVCTFKNKDVTINITDINDLNTDNTCIMLNPNIALYLLTIILKVLNYRYGRTEHEHQLSDTVNKKIIYF